MSTLYTAKATAIGGRNGTVRSDDSLIDLQLALPPGLGGKGDATNPEQLFAAGYAACFGNAVIHTTRNQDVKILDNDVEVTATVGIGPTATGGFGLTVALDVTLTGVDQTKAEEIVAQAHKVCPYSNATRGNVDVALSVHTR
ncbi:Ohr subfamily peroxiredoxin [Stenotrophomonas rhizophila]|uniref:Ohr subfamily peroxiredoxin n=1 Tax=Stenotrophomonas rhizophila TaxID=216778 RepID=A0A498CR48_9GAMM|nr:organic hydroperoxide resistance protein [Stenotrophomonas rhizophila]RLK56385.1 Ohr subfamily peroxiredoxin [Stenotrophomonas rhizophila]